LADGRGALQSLAADRWRIAVTLTTAMIVIYFGFIALIAYKRDLLAIPIVPGLTIGIALGAAVIVVSWILTYVYVRWANAHYDVRLAAHVRDEAAREDAATRAGGVR
jgi:uncharacterized membrane protein (DUF485 family)